MSNLSNPVGGLKLDADGFWRFAAPVVLPFHLQRVGYFIGWVSPLDVEVELGDGMHLAASDKRAVAAAVRATNWYIMLHRPDLPVPLQAEKVGPFDGSFTSAYRNRKNYEVTYLNPLISYGATQLALRWFKRHGGDQGAFSELGGPLPAVDRDIQTALEVVSYFRPVVA